MIQTHCSTSKMFEDYWFINDLKIIKEQSPRYAEAFVFIGSGFYS